MEIPGFIKTALDWLGENVPKASAFFIQKIAESTGQEQSQFVGKIVSLIILSGLFYFGTKIANKTAKYIMIILSIILIIAVIQSFL